MGTSTAVRAIQRKKPARRAFTGLAGSPLSKYKKLPTEKSDFTLRMPKTPDREEPTPFDVWFDEFGQKHGQIDLDCAFQTYQFDPHLGHGADPNVDSEKPGRERGVTPLQELGLNTDYMTDSTKKRGFSTGLIEGDREIKRRRRTDKNWWIFDLKLLREFLQSKFADDQKEAEKAALVLYAFYVQGFEDEYILLNENQRMFLDGDIKKVKQYRQYIVKQGAEMFKDLKPESLWHGRRAIWRGFKCSDPNCKQCSRNEVSKDFTGRF